MCAFFDTKKIHRPIKKDESDLKGEAIWAGIANTGWYACNTAVVAASSTFTSVGAYRTGHAHKLRQYEPGNSRGMALANKHVRMASLTYNRKKLLKFNRLKMKLNAIALKEG